MKKLISFLLFIIFAFIVNGQDTVYFRETNSSNPAQKKVTKRSSESNVIKISPFTFIGGSIPVYYEREITPFLSIQAGIGITSRNYLKGWIANLDAEEESHSGDFYWNSPTSVSNFNESDPYDYRNRKAQIGYFLSLQPKIYFESEGLDGSFISLSYDYYNYKTNQKKIVTGPTGSGVQFSNGTFKEFEKISDIMVNWGSQTLFDKVTLEYGFGLGIRNIKSNHYAYTSENGQYIDGYMENKKNKLAFNFSLKVGLHY